jgi:hypothetical protein
LLREIFPRGQRLRDASGRTTDNRLRELLVEIASAWDTAFGHAPSPAVYTTADYLENRPHPRDNPARRRRLDFRGGSNKTGTGHPRERSDSTERAGKRLTSPAELSQARQPFGMALTGPHRPPAVALRRAPPPRPGPRTAAVCRLQLPAVDEAPAPPGLGDEAGVDVARPWRHWGAILAPASFTAAGGS